MEASSAVFNWPSRSTASRLVVLAVTATCVVARATCAPISQPTGLATISTTDPTASRPVEGTQKGTPRVGPLAHPPTKRGGAKIPPLRGISVGACHIKQPANADG